MLSELVKTMKHKIRYCKKRGTVGYMGPLVHFSTQEGIIQTCRAVPSTCEVRPQTSKPPRATILWRQTARNAQRGFYTTRLQSSKRCCLRCAFQTFLYISCKMYIYIYIHHYAYILKTIGIFIVCLANLGP